jgi:hypothetical protein
MAHENIRFGRRKLIQSGALLGLGATGTSTAFAASGDGSAAFYDDFEDGNYTSDPAWSIYVDEGNFHANVVDQPAPDGGTKALQIEEVTGGGTNGVIGWADPLGGWDGEWTLSGLYYSEDAPHAPFQTHDAYAYYDPGSGDAGIQVNFGITDGDGRITPFEIGGELVDSAESTHYPGWDANTWYHWEVSHDGNGRYTGRIWKDGEGRPAEPNAVSTGSAPGGDPRVAAYRINGARYYDFEIEHAFVEWQRTAGGGSGGSLDGLIDAKQNKIDQIRNLASIELGDDRGSAVDQRAQSLLDDIDAAQGDATDAELGQYREALERMVAAEDVTRIGTSTVVGDDSVFQTMLDNLYSLAAGIAIELLSKVGGGILRRVSNSIIDDLVRRMDDLKGSFSGGGIVPGGIVDDIARKVDELATKHHYTFKSINQQTDDIMGDVADGLASKGLDGAKTEAENNGVFEALDENTGVIDALESLLFEAYYTYPDFPAVNIPRPDEIEVPDVNFYYDVPDEDLPGWLKGSVPDEIEADLDTPDIDLPDVPGLDAYLDLTEEFADLATVAGIDTTIDGRMDALDASIGGLAEQADDTRGTVRQTATDVMEGMDFLVSTFIEGLENAQSILSTLGDMAFAAMVAAVAGAALAIATGVGTLGLLAAAGVLATASTALGLIALALDAFQVAVGAGFLSFLTDFHHYGTYALVETDLGGVDL